MKYYPISLGVRRINWNSKSQSATHVVDSKTAKETVFQRDDYTCQCCGFRAKEWQEVLHLNGNANDFDDQNVLTTCIFCHQCFDLEQVSKLESGMLIWLPEMSQTDLNHLMRTAYIARRAQGDMNKLTNRIFDLLYARGDDAKRRLGSNNPDALALVMRDFLTNAEYKRAQKNMDGLRLLPLAKRIISDPEHKEGGTTNEFAKILNYWHRHAYPDLQPQDWTKIFQQAENLISP